MKKLFIVLFLIYIFPSCNSSGHLTKRYKSLKISESNDSIRKNIEVNTYVIEKDKSDPPKPKSIFDLSPKAQAALITELSKKDTSTVKYNSDLTSSLSSKSDNPNEIIDYSQFEKRFVVSIRNKSHFPADRIAKIIIILDIGDEVKMLSCNRLTTEFITIDLGKLNYSNTLSGELTGNALIETGTEAAVSTDKTTDKATGKAGAGLTGKLSASRSFSEEVMLKQRIVSLNAAITQNKLSLYQDGINGVDLTGNILADVTLGVVNLEVDKIYSFTELDKKEVLNPPEKIKVNEKLIIYPNIKNDIKAKISFEADYRKVLKGHKTISESDDRVHLYYGKCTNETEEIIIPKNKIQPKLWKLTFTNDPNKLPVQIKGVILAGPGDLLFNNIKEAKDFVFWLKSKYDDSKKSMTIGNLNYVIIMPSTFTTIQNIEIFPNN